MALVTDDPSLRRDELTVLHFTDTMWLHLLASLAWEHALEVNG